VQQRVLHGLVGRESPSTAPPRRHLHSKTLDVGACVLLPLPSEDLLGFQIRQLCSRLCFNELGPISKLSDQTDLLAADFQLLLQSSSVCASVDVGAVAAIRFT
jgi:hypothetical protein